MGLIPFGEFRPDVSSFRGKHTQRVENAFARGDGYGPVPNLAPYTQALPAACRGSFVARAADNTILLFAGTATKLYVMSNTTLAWTNASSSSGETEYALAAGDQWQFAQLGSVVLATNKNNVLQAYTIGSSTYFDDCSGSPPQAAYITVVNEFVVLSGLLSNPFRVQWSARSDSTGWTAGTDESDFQDFTDGGVVKGVAGGEHFGLLFQDSAIREMVYQPGTEIVFSFRRVVKDKGLRDPYSLVTAGERIFFRSTSGFEMMTPGSAPVPIGKERFDRTIAADLDTGAQQLVIGAYEPQTARIYWTYKNGAGAAGLFNRILVWDFVLERGALITGITGEYLASLAQPGLTLDGLDSIAPGAMDVAGAASNGSGLIRIGVADASSLTTGDQVTITGVTGTTEANGTWIIEVIDGTHFDLVEDLAGNASVFTNAYVSGGLIGGSLDALNVSLDDLAAVFTSKLTIFGSEHKAGFLSGAALEATMETAEFGGDGYDFIAPAVKPETDAATVYTSILSHDRLSDTPAVSVESQMNATGLCFHRVNARNVKYRMRIPAGTAWSFAIGVEPTDAQR